MRSSIPLLQVMDLDKYIPQVRQAADDGKVFCYCLACRKTKDGHILQSYVPKFITRPTAVRHKKDVATWPNQSCPELSSEHPMDWFDRIKAQYSTTASPATPPAGEAGQGPVQHDPPAGKRQRTNDDIMMNGMMDSPTAADDLTLADQPPLQPVAAHPPEQAPQRTIDQHVQDRAWGRTNRLWHNKIMIGQWASIDYNQPMDEVDAWSRVPGMHDGATRVLYAKRSPTANAAPSTDEGTEGVDDSSGECMQMCYPRL